MPTQSPRPRTAPGKPPKDGLFRVYDPETGLLVRTEHYGNGALDSAGDEPSVLHHAPDGSVIGRDWHKGGELHRDAGPTRIADGEEPSWIRNGVPYAPLPFEEVLYDKNGKAVQETPKVRKPDYGHALGEHIQTTDTIEAENAARNASLLAFKPDEKPPELALAKALRARPPRTDGEPHRAYDARYQIAIEGHTVKEGKGHRFHRTDGPALKVFNGKTGEQTEEWHKDGKWHADGRPAIVEPDPDRPGQVRTRWYREGKPYLPTGEEREAWAETVKKQGGPYYVEPTAPDIGTADFKASAARQDKQDEREKEAKKGKVKEAAKAAAQNASRGVDKVGQFAKYVLSTADDLTR
jgi:hypothetical protein